MATEITQIKLPDYLTLAARPSLIEAKADDELPSFTMVAYSGGLMRIKGFPHPLVVDMHGLEIPSQQVPIRLDHKSNQGVGHSTRIEASGYELIAEGLISRDTAWARDVARSGTNGFPWQASIGGPVIEAEFIADGQTVEVNGQTFEGPLHVVRKMILKEISFVDTGADSQSKAIVHAQAEEFFDMGEQMGTDSGAQTPVVETPGNIETPTEVEAKGVTETVKPPVEKVKPQPTSPEGKTVEASFDMAGLKSQLTRELRETHVAELKRMNDIRKITDGFPEIEAQAIEAGWDLTRCELEVLRTSRPKAPAGHIKRSNRPTMQVLEATAMAAGGIDMSRIESIYGDQTLEAADKLRGIGIQEFCELASGQQLPRFRRDASGWLQAAFSTASLPGILSNLANKMLLEGYNYIEDSWRKICKTATVNNFMEHTRYRMTSNFTFQKVGPDGEIKHGKVDEQTFGQKAETHAIMFALTRQMIINDDLGALTDIPLNIGMGSAEAIADATWGLLLSNPMQSDGKKFFDAAHEKLAAGANTALTIDGLTAAEVMFGNQTKPNGRPLGASARLLLVPTALKVAAELLMHSLQLNETTTTDKAKPQSNPHVGKFEVVSSVYLSNSTFSGASGKAWYLLTDPRRMPAIEVAFLGGVDRPTVERADADFNTLGVQFRGYIDFGVREQDYRAALKMKGEA